MIGIDTNILVRYVTEDDHHQTAKVNHFFQKSIKEGHLLWVSVIVLCELIWVLEDCYQCQKNEIGQMIQRLLSVEHIEIESKECVYDALKDFYRSNADFSDCLIGRCNLANGCTHTISFDKKTHSLSFFSHL